MRVRDVMESRVQTVSPDMSLLALERFLLSESLSGAPVVKDGKLVGIVSRSDVVRQLIVERAETEYVADAQVALGLIGGGKGDLDRWITDTAAEQLETLHVEDAMIHDVKTVPPEASIQEAARVMVENDIHRVVVTDNDQLSGILTSTDLVRLVANGTTVAVD